VRRLFHFLPLLVLASILGSGVNAAEPLRTLALTGPMKAELDSAQKVAVVVFMSARCPCSASHEIELNQLAKEFSPFGVKFIGVHANANESEGEMKQHFSRAPLSFPWLEDRQGTWAQTFGAVKTPHSYLVDSRGQVFYEGGVTGSHDAAQATDRPLRTALEAFVAGRTIDRPRTRTLGCAIARRDASR
jgi:peroxiredoxin